MPEPVSAAPLVPAHGETPLVLVADDDEVILGLITYRLEHSGYRVIAAPFGLRPNSRIARQVVGFR